MSAGGNSTATAGVTVPSRVQMHSWLVEHVPPSEQSAFVTHATHRWCQQTSPFMHSEFVVHSTHSSETQWGALSGHCQFSSQFAQAPCARSQTSGELQSLLAAQGSSQVLVIRLQTDSF